MYSGSCLCGTIKYEVRGEIGASVYCHCSRCRKASGSVVAFNAPAAGNDFAVVAGEGFLKSFDMPEVQRFFCSNCGSQLFSRRTSAPDIVRLRLGTLDVLPATGPQAHIFVDSKVDWFEIHDDAPQFAQMPPAEFMRMPPATK